MGRELTPERQKLKQEALSLRYDYGLSIRDIAGHLDVKKSTIDVWVSKNIRTVLSSNNGHITHLEGDCLEILPTLPDKAVDVLLTDPPYSIMNDYEWDKKDNEFYHRWLATLKPKLKGRHSGFIFFDARRSFEFEGILRNYFSIINKIIWIRKNMSKGLGKVEKIVLRALKRDSDHKVLCVWDLAWQVYYGIDCFETGTVGLPQPPCAVYQTTCRAVRSLERKGLIKCGKRDAGFDRPSPLMTNYHRRGGDSWSKVVELVSV